MKKILPFLFFLFVIQLAVAQNYIINKIAGDSLPGFNADGIPAIDANLNDPLSSATDLAGNVYIADANNYRVRKVGVNGIIYTIAGNGFLGYKGDGGPATAAEISIPTGVACDDSGNIYIADMLNNAIRKVNTKGIITTIAGNGGNGFSGDSGPATAAELSEPRGVVLDDTGNIYIADQANNRIRKVNTAGIITTYAGNGNTGYKGDGGQADSAEFNDPTALSLDDTGNLYIADCYNNVIRKINKGGIISTFAGDSVSGFAGDGGPATAAELVQPLGVAADRWGNVYIADLNSQRIRKVYTDGIINTIAGTGVEGHSGDGGPALAAKLGGPIGVYADVLGNIFITEYINGNNDVRKLNINCSIALAINPASATLCIGDSINLKAVGNAASYTWYPTTALSTSTGDSAVATPLTSTTYAVSALDSPGCDIIVDIAVKVNPIPSLSVDPSGPSVCSGTGVALIASGASSYQWSPATGLNTTTGDSVVAGPTTVTTYIVTGTNASDCSTTDTAIVYVIPAPNMPTITVSVTGDSLFSSALTDNQWFFDGVAIKGDTGKILVIKGHTKGYFSVTVTNEANGCSTSSDSVAFSGIAIAQLSVNSYQLSIYPNPTSGIINISSSKNIDAVTVTNLLGQVIYTSQPKQTHFNFELSEEGMYFVSIILNGEIVTDKVVVNK